MARRARKKPRSYPRGIVFDENLEGVGTVFGLVRLNLPQVLAVNKSSSDHSIAMELSGLVFFTADKHWLTRQPPHEHGGIVFLDTGNLAMEEKAVLVRDFLYAFHIKNRVLDTLAGRRFRLSKHHLWEVFHGGEEKQMW